MSLRELCRRILPICTYFVQIERFLESHQDEDHGLVSQSLCATISGLLQEYLVMVAQLEHEAHTTDDFSLQKVWFYIGPNMATLATLASLVDNLSGKEILQNDIKGGVLLTMLSNLQIENGG